MGRGYRGTRRAWDTGYENRIHWWTRRDRRRDKNEKREE